MTETLRVDARSVIEFALFCMTEGEMLEAERIRLASGALEDLRHAAGGADRVVLAWEPTPCATCDGKGHHKRSSFEECLSCGGSGVDGYTVTLHTLVEDGTEFDRPTPEGQQ